MERRKTLISENPYQQEKNHNIEDTIVAAATPLGVGAIGIVKLSGPRSIEIGAHLCHPRSGKEVSKLPNFKMTLCDIYDPKNKMALDEGLIVLMRGPFSYTREDVVEIQVHGGPLIIKKIIQLCLDLGARLAEPGEFTKRAFLRGRLDISQAEAVAELVKAYSEKALMSSYRSLRGLFGEKVSSWQKQLVFVQAYIQAECDYPDVMIDDIHLFISEKLYAILQEIEIQYDRSKRFQVLQKGYLVVICGKPNVGKSSLLNSIIGEGRAIVTQFPGTTRDAIEEIIQIDGYPFRLVDTAGIRESQDYIEKIAIDKAREYLEDAHLIVVIFDRSQELQEEDYRIVELVKKKPHLIALNKSDLNPKLDQSQISQLYPGEEVIEISALYGKGIDVLVQKIVDTVCCKEEIEEDFYAINNRQQKELSRTASYLRNAIQSLQSGYPIDIISLDIDQALRCLKRINGEDIDRDIIDTIFKSFCIGK